MRDFPIFLSLRDRPVLVVAGGPAAGTKILALRRAGATVTAVGAAVTPDLAELIARGEVQYLPRPFAAGDLAGMVLVVSASADDATDRRVSAAAQAAGVPVNVVDRLDLSTFLIPAIVDRDPVTVCVATAGTAPVLARRIRALIEALLPANLGRLARFADDFRPAVRAVHSSGGARRRFWERFFDGPIAAAVLAGSERWARERMIGLINRPEDADARDGVVHIVGAGPGDPDLLTVRAQRLLQEADVIIHDRLVSAAVLDRARRDADFIAVGKAPGGRGTSQETINEMLLAAARRGQRVVRLKGGDPFIFGRGGEELEYLRAHGIRAEVVPGITAALGCAAAAGIALTHRDHAHAVTFVTGRGKDGAGEPDWPALAQPGHSVVFYMGAAEAPNITARLLAAGADPAMPVCLMVNGTRPDQSIATGRLDALPSLTTGTPKDAPVLIIIGNAVATAGLLGAAADGGSPDGAARAAS